MRLHRYIKKALFWICLLPTPLLASLSPTFVPQPPVLSARSYLLLDARTHRVIAEKSQHERVEPASLTKMMTIYVVDQLLQKGQCKESDLVTISEYAWKAPGSRMFLEVNTQVKIEDLKKGVIIQSGNDASIALAEHLAGSEAAFANLMNQYAQSLGMKETHFMNASGLPDPNHYTTAHDMGLLATALIKDFPHTYRTYSEKSFQYKEIKQDNRNRLLWSNPLVDGIKTGHTDSAGYCLVASGKKGDSRFIAVVMGTPDDKIRTQDTNALLNFGFQFFETKKLYSAGSTLKRSRIWHGKQKEIDLGVSEDVYVTVSSHDLAHIKAAIETHDLIKAPTQPGAVLGKLSIQIGDQSPVEQPIVALQEIPRAGIFSRTWDTFHLTYNRWFSPKNP